MHRDGKFNEPRSLVSSPIVFPLSQTEPGFCDPICAKLVKFHR